MNSKLFKGLDEALIWNEKKNILFKFKKVLHVKDKFQKNNKFLLMHWSGNV